MEGLCPHEVLPQSHQLLCCRWGQAQDKRTSTSASSPSPGLPKGAVCVNDLCAKKAGEWFWEPELRPRGLQGTDMAGGGHGAHCAYELKPQPSSGGRGLMGDNGYTKA